MFSIHVARHRYEVGGGGEAIPNSRLQIRDRNKRTLLNG